MNAIPNLNTQRDDLQKTVVARTQEVALNKLDEEYERAKTNITGTSDLRKLKSMVKRIDYLNNPRSTSRRSENIEPSEK